MKKTLDIVYDQIFNQGKTELLPDVVSGPYIQHNPLLPNGVDALIGFIKHNGRLMNEVKRVAIDGDLAFVHARYPDIGGKEMAVVDIFRFDGDGKIAEHWDVLQAVPATSNNTNTMF
jgi:predicted SnoaL-like aldol condensation-catalyzing enzyme